jgi:hypothetical protein
MDTHSLEYWKPVFDRIAAASFLIMRELGEKLLEAEQQLSGADTKALEEYLLHTWTHADLKAARAIATGELKEELFPAGVRNSKVLSLTKQDQQRLLDGEEFPVWGNDARIHRKTWYDMSTDERNRLLGKKGGRIHPPDEQSRPGASGVVRVSQFARATLVDDTLSMSTSSGLRGEIQVGILKATLEQDELEMLIEKLQS